MLKFTFLGTCSGTEPISDTHHTAFVIEINGAVYWFDAGENCSHSAYTSGIDVACVRAVFISHMHIDHTGGLANLIFTINKDAITRKVLHGSNNSYDIFVPELQRFQAVKEIATAYRGESSFFPDIIEHEVRDGALYEDENIKVSAIHNSHLGEDGSSGWHSYSYLIEAEGKRIVYSGDVKRPEELDEFTSAECDLLIMETGHHPVASVCEYVKARGIKQLLFNHQM